MFFNTFQHVRKDVIRRSGEDLPFVRIGSSSIRKIEVSKTVSPPPAFYDIAIESGIEVPRIFVILVHEGSLRPLRLAVKVADEVGDIQRTAEKKSVDFPLRKRSLEFLSLRFVPRQRQAIIGGW